MISSIHCLILVLLSFHLVHGSITLKKRKTPHSPQKTTNNLEHIQSESDTSEDPLDHQAKRQAIESVENNSLHSLDNGTGTISPESSSTSSSTSLRQSIPQLNGRVSASRPKKNTSTVLRDTTNTVEEVQPVGVPAMTQDTSEQQEILQAENITLVPFRMEVKGGQFYYFHLLSDFHEWIALKNVPLKPFGIFFDNIATRFQLSRTSDTLSVILSLLVPIPGRIGVQLVGFKKPYDKTKQMFVPSTFLNESLVSGMVLSLGKFKDISALAQNNQYIYLQVEASIEPGHHDIMIRKDVLEQVKLGEIQRASKLIEQLLQGKKYKEIEKLGDSMTCGKFLKCLLPTISTLEHYENLADYLKRKQMMTDFFMYGNMEVIEEFIRSCGYAEDHEYIDDGDLEVALHPIFEEGHYERFVDLLEIRRQITVDADEAWMRDGEMPTFECFLWNFFGNSNFKDGMSIKRFFDHHEMLNNKCPKVMESFCGELVCELKKSRRHNLRNVLDGLIGQPSLLSPTAFCYGFLFNADCAHDIGDDELSYFVEHSWKESIREGLEGGYAFGGGYLWEFMTRMFPDAFSGECPIDNENNNNNGENNENNNELLEAVCSKFPTKQQLEEGWLEWIALVYLAKIDTAAPVFDLLPEASWIIISQYAVTWFDI